MQNWGIVRHNDEFSKLRVDEESDIQLETDDVLEDVGIYESCEKMAVGDFKFVFTQ